MIDAARKAEPRRRRADFRIARSFPLGVAAVGWTTAFYALLFGFFLATAKGALPALILGAGTAYALCAGIVAWDEWLERLSMKTEAKPLAIHRYGLSGPLVGSRILRFHRVAAVEWPVRGGTFAFLRALTRMRPADVRFGRDLHRARIRLVTGGTVDLRLSGLEEEPAVVVGAIREALAEFRADTAPAPSPAPAAVLPLPEHT